MIKNLEIIKNLTKEDFEQKRADLHIHTTYSDGCATFSEVVQQAKDKDYKIIAITDHNTIQGHLDYPNENVLTGVEFDVW